MLGKNRLNKLITSLTAVAMLCAYSSIAIAAPGKDGEITVNGKVTVNGERAVSNSTIVSGSTVSTGADSGAVLNFGSNGKVELMPDTSVTITFTDSTIGANLTSGHIKVLNSAGVSSTVTTKSAKVVGDTGQANSYSVDVGCSDDVRCTQTFVETSSGLVTLTGDAGAKQVAAGTGAVSGNQQSDCKPCMRPGTSRPLPVAGLSGGAIAAILAAAGAAAIAAIILSRENEVTTDDGIIVISPVN